MAVNKLVNLTPLNTGWVAGLLEGEGCFSLRRETYRDYPRVDVISTDRDVLAKAMRLTGLGKLYGPYLRPTPNFGSQKPQWRWTVHKQDEARELMSLMLPMMGKRRKAQIRNVLTKTRRQESGGNL